jgi:hypothetical protein
MPLFSPDMTEDQKTFLAIGQFIYFFSSMEDQLNRSLRSLLGLGLLEGAIVTSNVDVRTKVYMILTAMNMRPMKEEEWLKEARSDLKAVVKLAERRNILAHNSFTGRDGAVEFFYTKAKGTLSLPDEIWTFEAFDAHCVELDRLSVAIKAMTERVVKHPATALGKAISETVRNMDPDVHGSLEAMFGNAQTLAEPEPKSGD